jgi:phage replication O-like protein O
MTTANQATFQGFQFPTTTPVPDEVFDVLMPQLSGAELKVLLYICRRTFGFKKDSDTISLHQIAQGIKTRDGRVLDGGTGLCKRHVQRALKVLEKKNIITVTRTVDEAGLNTVNTYSLNMHDMESGIGTKSPRPRDNMSPGVGTSGSGGVETPVSTTTNSNQETVLQETDTVVDVIAQDLENFGIAKSAVTRLVQDYPVPYIREKLAMAKELAAAGSCLVSQNPAGWLRKAIEENYSPPRTCHHSRHKARETKGRKTAQAAARDPGAAEQAQSVATESEQTVPTETGQCHQNVATELEPSAPTDSEENIPEKKEPEKTSREKETTWLKTLEKLQEALPVGETGMQLKGTSLIQLTDTAARILVPSTNALLWLERRMYGHISKAMKEVLGKELDLQFVAAA